jgi:NRPS condensation-like uncharacterized protein
MSPPRRQKLLASVQDWFFLAISLGHDRTIRLTLELDGAVDHPRLARALHLLLEAEPVLRCRFTPGLFRAYWREREDIDRLELCRLIPTVDLRRDLHEFMAGPIDPCRDPLIQVGVFRSATDTVCIKICHVAMDGGGFKQLVHRLTTLYRALAIDPSSVLPPDLASDRSQGQVLRGFPLRERLRAFFTQPFHRKAWSFPYLAGPPGDVTFSERTLGVKVPALREAAKARGATITDALMAGFVRAVFETTATPAGVPLPFTVAMDLRRYLPAPEAAALCNLSSLAWIELVKRPGASIDETLADVHRTLAAAMSDKPGIGLAMVMELAAVLGHAAFVAGNRIRIRLARRQGREFPSLSNVGVMDPRGVDFGDARVTMTRFYGSVIYPPTFYIVSGSFQNVLYLTVSYPRSVVPGDLVERVLDRVVREVESLC